MLMPFVCHPNILHKYCFQFLLGPFWLPRETEDIAKGKILGLQTPLVHLRYTSVSFFTGFDKIMHYNTIRDMGYLENSIQSTLF